jgi:glycine dehydrogenase subunit 1
LGTYIPHTDDEIEQMLAFLGLSTLDQLFTAVPEAVRLQHALELADGAGEPDVLDRMEGFAERNRARSDRLVCFAGGGAYDHEIPSVTRALAGRSEFVTSYTPYQPEVAQGVLQAVFEYQTMVARIAGLAVANASLYDGGSAAVEAVNLGVAASGRQTVWVSEGIHPHWRQMLATFAVGTGHRIRTVPLRDGVTAWPDAADATDGEAPGVVLVGYPNYLGCLEDLGAVRVLCDRTGALMVVGADPLATGLLRSAGSWGADVMVGEGQMFGTTLGFGGPYLGLFACSSAHVRRLPGRLVGETVDLEGRTAYVTTLRAREQDIRREKATSNVCTNQTLMAVTAAIQLSWLGTSGLVEVATRCARATRYARDAVLAIDGITPWAGAPVLREFAVRLPVAAETVVERMADAGFLAGISLEGAVDGGAHGLLIAATERRTAGQIDAYATALAKAIA